MSRQQIDPTKWVDKYSDYLFNYTITRVNDREVANDLISETFLAGLRSMSNFKGEASERTWLISILKRKIIDHYRHKNTKKSKAEVHMGYIEGEDEGDWLEERVADSMSRSAEEQIENDELGDAIFNCLEKLPSRQAEIFKLKTIDGQDTKAICNAFDITASNLWVIIHRARKSMADCLEKNWLA